MNNKKVGLICGSPLCGLGIRECIEVTKVLDGCSSQIGDQQFAVTIADPGGTPPYTFTSLVSNGPTQVSNLVVTPFDELRSRVAFDATVPVLVSFTDSTGAALTAETTVTFHREVVLKLPAEGALPYAIEVATSIRSGIGAFISPTEISCRVCILQVVKVTMRANMLVPSYGSAEFPVCTEAGPCEGLANLPLFPPLI